MENIYLHAHFKLNKNIELDRSPRRLDTYYKFKGAVFI